MSDPTTTSRVLLVLSLLQSRRYWPGSELAERIGASPRTVRRDIERLRELGYRVVAERGTAGGYLLEAGSDMPPLLFTSDEAVALAMSLRIGTAEGAVRGMADLSIAVLAKLEQVLPPDVRRRVRALQSTVPPAGPVRDSELIDPETLAVLALVCRDSEVVRFTYAAASVSKRRVEPIAVVPWHRRWYLLAWDLERDDWRTFRIDRISDATHTHLHVPPRPLSTDAATFVAERLRGPASDGFAATVRIDAPLDVVEDYLGAFTTGLAAQDEDHTEWRIRDDRLEVLAGALTWLIWPFEIVEGTELREFLARFAERAAL